MQRFEAMKEALDEHDLELVAISKDTVAEAAHHRERDGLSLKLLSDPELEVIRQYGLEHHKAIDFSIGSFRVFGIPLAFVPTFKSMAIPTTLLVDESGIVRWIDQADDYRMRSDDRRVRDAIETAFAPAVVVS